MFGSGLDIPCAGHGEGFAKQKPQRVFGTLLEIVKSDRKLATSNKATEVHCQKIADFE